MQKTADIHQQFADYFPHPELRPFLYLLSKKLDEGHICINLSEVEAEELPAGYEEATWKKSLEKAGGIGKPGDFEPIIKDGNTIYFHRYFTYETNIVEKILAWGSDNSFKSSAIKNLNDHAAAVKNIITAGQTSPDKWQVAAALLSVTNKFTIITGGPGTGKTTTVAKALAVFFTLNPDLKVALAAPTGKAAARMAEALRTAGENFNENIREKFELLEPSTIHRLLGYQPNSIHFAHNEKNKLPHQLVIIDESSMIDVALFSKLLSAIPDTAQLIMLGDKNQLSAIEAGSLFGDICQAQENNNSFSKATINLLASILPAEKFPEATGKAAASDPLFEKVIELQRSFRFNDDEGIGKLSKAVINNDAGGISSFFKTEDEQVAIVPHDNIVSKNFLKNYEPYINERDTSKALQLFSSVRILCATKQGQQGVYAMNELAEKYLQSKNLIKRSTEFYENMPVMITANDAAIKLFNGDIGLLRRDEDGVLKAWFLNADGELRNILPAYLKEWELVFAMTIHKSQGSEFDEVLLSLPATANAKILSRELLYTGITRAKKKLIIAGTEEVVLAAASRAVHRSSGLQQRLQTKIK